MDDLAQFRPLSLPPDETRRLETLMTTAFECMSQAAIEKYGFRKTKQLRNDYKRGLNMWWHPRARALMDELAANEDTIVRAYIRLGFKAARQMQRQNPDSDASVGDYLVECATALYDAMYCYNGETRFSTYATWAIRNRLIDFVRADQQAAGVGKRLKRLRVAVRREMQAVGSTVDQAVAKVASDLQLAADEAARLRDAMYHVGRPDEDAGREGPDTTEADAMREAIARTPLLPIQRELMQIHLSGERGYQTRLARERVNPGTGRLYTKAILSNLFVRACDAVRTTYNEMEQRAA
jgi:RNA polymerase sigma factor (sigma-70 family)